MSTTIYERIYKRLVALGLDFDNPPEGAVSKAPGIMDLHFDLLGTGEDSVEFTLSHYYEQNGDLVADPDMEIRVYPEIKAAEAMTYQDTYRYDSVHTSDGRIDAETKASLNTFLLQWLKNCFDQRHTFTGGKEP